MGRNVKEARVGVNGSIYRNSSQLGPIVESDGSMYIPSTTQYTVAATDFPKYVGLNTAGTVGLANAPVNPQAVKSGGIVEYSPTRSISFDGNSPYIQTVDYYPPLIGKRAKTRFLGARVSNGNYAVITQKALGYRFTNGAPAFVYNTATKTFVDRVCQFAYAAWYDSATSTYRVVGHNGNSSSQPSIFTSSDAINWSSTQLASTGTNEMYPRFGGDGSYTKTGAMISGQKVFMVLLAGGALNNYALFTSTNNGASFIDRSTAVSGNGSVAYFAPSGSANQVCYNHDGTTLFLACSSPDNGRFSTNDGSTFSNSTVSGVTSAWSGAFMCQIMGANSSTFMMVHNNQATSNRIYVTTNGGQSFTTYNWTPSVAIDSSYANMVGDFDTATGTFCFIYQSISGAYAARSTDGGATWSHSKIDSRGSNSVPNMAYLDDAFYYHDNVQTLYRSVNGSTWTAINALVTSPNGWAYGTPWFTLTDYVVFTNSVIRKSDQAVVLNWSSNLLGNGQRTFCGYLTDDYFLTMSANIPTYSQSLTSATASSYTYFTNPTYTNQQQGTAGLSPINIEFWRIK
jgi:hypothetical protein